MLSTLLNAQGKICVFGGVLKQLQHIQVYSRCTVYLANIINKSNIWLFAKHAYFMFAFIKISLIDYCWLIDYNNS